LNHGAAVEALEGVRAIETTLDIRVLTQLCSEGLV